MFVRLLDHKTKAVQNVDLELYLMRVVSGEMPPDWPMPALMAQAVAARSYTYFALNHPRHRHEGADLCMPESRLNVHCQAYHAYTYETSAEAVMTTKGMVITYNDQVARAYYHAACGGRTLTCGVDIWVVRFPYLVAVPCGCNRDKFGHGVGMCQYGARAMAEAGSRLTIFCSTIIKALA